MWDLAAAALEVAECGLCRHCLVVLLSAHRWDRGLAQGLDTACRRALV